MHLRHLAALGALAVLSTSSFADAVTTPLDLSQGNTGFGRNNAIGSFIDTYTFTLSGSSYFASATASSASSGTQDLDFTSLVIANASDVIVATFAGNLGNDATEFYSLTSTLLSAGAYRLIVTGVNSPTQASYSGNIAISASVVPEPTTTAMVTAGLLAMGLLSRRRKPE